MTYAIPKYTQYQLSQMVNYELQNKNITLQEACAHYSVEKELLQDILGEKVRFKAKHYQVVSKITGHSIEELLDDEVIKPISFRSLHNENNQEANDRIDIISNFFKDVALLKKLNGKIHFND